MNYKTVNEKYDDFKNNEQIKDTVNNFFTNIYNTKKETTPAESGACERLQLKNMVK